MKYSFIGLIFLSLAGCASQQTVLLAVGTASPLRAHDEKHDKKADKADASDKKAKAYPLDKCVVTDEKLGDHGKPYVFTHKGQEVKLCCKDCLKDFKKEPDKYLKKIDADASKK